MSYSIYTNPFQVIPTGNSIRGNIPVATNYNITPIERKYGTGWDGSKIIISIPANQILANRIALILKNIEQVARSKVDNFKGTITVATKTFNLSLDQLTLLKVDVDAMADDATITQTAWQDSDGSVVILNVAQTNNLRKAFTTGIRNARLTIFQDMRNKKIAAKALTEDTIDLFDVKTGWTF